MARGKHKVIKGTLSSTAQLSSSGSKGPYDGVKRFHPKNQNLTSPILHIASIEHISHTSKQEAKFYEDGVPGFGNTTLIHTWYSTLPENVKRNVDASGFRYFISILKNGQMDRVLLKSLAEKWWDTTHTFHLDEVGVMTMTPLDFAAITDLKVASRQLDYDLDLCNNNKKALRKLIDKPLSEL